MSEPEFRRMMRQHYELPDEVEEEFELEFEKTPREVKELLDKDVIGQERAKKFLANAICYHYARINREQEGETTIKKNILLIGNTGVGKTYLVHKLSEIVGVPMAKADATKFSATGYVGRNVEEMIKELFINANGNKKLAEAGIVYVDEIDKIRKIETTGRDVSGAEVQRGLLTLMEDCEVDIMRGELPAGPTMNTRNILFIMAGAFPGLDRIVKARIPPDDHEYWHAHVKPEDLEQYGMEAEFVGRLPIRVGLDDLSEDDLYRILKESGESIIKQYQKDFLTYGIITEFTDDALKEFAKRAAIQNTGARALIGVIEHALTDFMYELPSYDIKELVIDADLVRSPREKLIMLIGDEKLDEYAATFAARHKIELRYADGAKEYLKQHAVNHNCDLQEACDSMIGQYADKIKSRAITITTDILRDPDSYFRGDE